MAKALSRLGQQIAEVVVTLDKIGARFALIGGLALAPHKVLRATQDVDLLIDADFAQSVDSELKSLGYECLHRSNDAANYLRGDQRLDFLYAHRPAARGFLTSASELTTPFGTLHVVSAEALIAFKLQGWVNNPPLSGDGGLDARPAEVSDPLGALDDLMQVVEALCPTYPTRAIFSDSSKFKL